MTCGDLEATASLTCSLGAIYPPRRIPMEELNEGLFDANSARAYLGPADGDRQSSAIDESALSLPQTMRSSAGLAAPTETVLPHKTSFEELDVVIDQDARIFWQYMKPKGRPSYTPGLLRDMRRALQW